MKKAPFRNLVTQEKPTRASAVDVFDARCPSRQFLALVGDRWTLLVLARLETGTQRNRDLLRDIGGLRAKVLSSTLRKLEEHGLVKRTVHAVVPPHVDYTLTPLGRRLARVVVRLDRWITNNFSAIEAAKARYRAKTRSRAPWQTPRVA